MDLFIQYGVAAGVQAFKNSGIEINEENAGRIGVAVGSGIGGLGLIEENHQKILNTSPRKLSPFFCAFHYYQYDLRALVYHVRFKRTEYLDSDRLYQRRS